MGSGARENRRSMTPMPDTDYRVPISLHGYRCAGKPAIHDAHAGHGPDESDRSLCGVPVMPDESARPLRGVPVMPDESARPLCGVPVMPDESARPSCGMPVMPDESARPSCGVPVGVRRVPCGTSPGRCPSCRASPVPTRVLVEARRAGRVPCGNESWSIPVICHAPAQHGL